MRVKNGKRRKALKFVLFTTSMAQYHKADSPIDRRSIYFCHIIITHRISAAAEAQKGLYLRSYPYRRYNKLILVSF